MSISGSKMGRAMSPLVKNAEHPAPPKTLLIEGWRGISHSIALVNQHQILELLKLNGLKLYHHDLPFAFSHWTRTAGGSGFGPADHAAVEKVPPLPDDVAIDCVYRICAPIRAGDPADRRRTVTFMITEMGLGSGSFADGGERSDFFTRGENAIVTASEWSRQRLLDHGYAAEKVSVIPLGADTTAFTPLTEVERTLCRVQMGFHSDETVFVNVGVALWNKGMDVLLRAFAVLRARGRRVRLVLKDQRDVYGISIEQTLRSTGASCPELLQPETLAAISVIPDKLERAQLRTLYGIADAYVSPYRAEGFNLPVLEAIACGTPLIVTQGGATDDFCSDDVAWRIPGRESVHIDPATGAQGRYIEPDLEALVATMDGLASGRRIPPERYIAARENVLAQFTWAKAAAQVAALTVGLKSPHAAAPAVAAPLNRPVQQCEVLSLLDMIRPLAMANGTKVRVGNVYDGGYVVPNRALGCDAVLSIGVGHDVSFDLALAHRGAMVVQFDHTVEASPSAHANFRFHKRGWGAETKGDLLSFADMRSAFDAVPARRPMLKFDVEGAEYDALAAMTHDDLIEFEVITCELHDFARLGERDMLERIRNALEKLTRHHAPVHLHANNCGGLTLVAGVPVPGVLELTLLRRDLDQFPGASDEPMPGALDRPNNPSVSDICLRAF
jgi:glycosyltransferase involved in cell wall biosynthesis